MSAEYDDFEESLLREARRRSSPRGAKARAIDALVASSASATLGIAFGRHFVGLKLWAKSAGLPTAVAMIGGSAIYAAMIYGRASAERVRLEEAPPVVPSALSLVAPPELTTPPPIVEPPSDDEGRRVDVVSAGPTPRTNAPRMRPRSAAAPKAPAVDAPTSSESTESSTESSATSAPAGGLGRLGRENALIQTAQAALRRGDIQAAFEALDQHGQHFGASGALASEAEVLRIEALARAGRRPEAEARARLLITTHPRSSLVRRVRVSLGREGATP